MRELIPDYTVTELNDLVQLLYAIDQRLRRLEQYTMESRSHRRAVLEVITHLIPDSDPLQHFSDDIRFTFLKQLTQQERQAAKLTVDCLRNAEIAIILNISKGTVANLLSNIYGKLHTMGVFGSRVVERPELIRFFGDFLSKDVDLD